jgi:hypothetical protein
MVDQMITDDSPSTTAPTKEAVATVTDEASTQASELTNAAKEHAGAVVAEAKDQARNVVKDAQGELHAQAEQQARRVGQGLGEAGTQLRKMAERGEPGAVTDLTRQLAGAFDRMSQRISDGGVSAIGDDLRGFARKQPGLFLLGAGVAGFVLTRAVRATGAASGSDTQAPQPGPPSTAPRTAPVTEPAPLIAPLAGATDPGASTSTATPR